MKILKRWHPMQVVLLGEPVAIEVKALQQREVGAFLNGMAGVAKALQAGRPDDGGEPDVEALVREMGVTLTGPFVEDVFDRFVRVAEAEPVAIEGEAPIASGLDVLREAGFEAITSVLYRIQGLAQMSATEGKALPSPSTSPQDATAAPDAGGSPATSTVPEAGPTP